MKYLYEELPAVEVAGTKLVGRMLFSLLVLASALIGACVGLLIVYSTDLPEVSQLENYRPSAITEIYDDKGREVGSFAIQRRVIVSYDELPKGLSDALLSTGFPPDLRGQERTLDWWRYFSLRAQSLRRTGSTALNLAYVAAGRFDGFWAFDNNAWDVAGRLWYDTLLQLSTSSQFLDCAKLTVQVAGTPKYGAAAKRAVKAAWKKVGITV